MVETMVGILIGLIVIVVTFNILAVAEAHKRTTVGAADAQITGLLSHIHGRARRRQRWRRNHDVWRGPHQMYK